MCVLGGRLCLTLLYSHCHLHEAASAEKVLHVVGVVKPGTHTFSKFVSHGPGELIDFFTKPLTTGARPWITRTFAQGLPTRLEAPLRCAALSIFRGVVIWSWYRGRRRLGRRKQIICFGHGKSETQGLIRKMFLRSMGTYGA